MEAYELTEQIASDLKIIFERYHRQLNEISLVDYVPSYDLSHTSLNQNKINFDNTELCMVASHVDNYETNLEFFKQQMDTDHCFYYNAFIETHGPLLNLFRSNLKRLHDILNEEKCKQTPTPIKLNDEELLANMHLDFQLSSLIERENYHMTSTPRNNQDKKQQKQELKTFSDKSVATIEEKSSQTEAAQGETHAKKCANKQHKSLDSGIGAYENSTQSANYLLSHSFSSPVSALSYNKTQSSKLLSQKEIHIKMNLKHDKTFDSETSKSMPAGFTELRKRNFNKTNELFNLVSNQIEADTDKSDNAKVAPVKELLTGPQQQQQQAIEESSSTFSMNRFLKYLLFLIFCVAMLLMIHFYVILPVCCDFERQILPFNLMNYNDNKPAPF